MVKMFFNVTTKLNTGLVSKNYVSYGVKVKVIQLSDC